MDQKPVDIPTRYLRDPAVQSIQSRVRSERHAQELEGMLKVEGWSNAHAASVVRLSSHSKSFAELSPGELEQGFYVLSGDHRRSAIQKLHTNFPRNPLFKSVPCIHYSCSDTQANRRMLVLLGSAANTDDHTIRRVEFYDKYIHLRELLALGEGDKDTQLKTDYAAVWKVSPGQIGHILTMLRREPVVEAYALRWAQGEVIWRTARKGVDDDVQFDPADPRNTRPESLGALVHLGSLIVEDQLALLEEVFSCKVSVSSIKSRIDYLAIERYLKTEIAIHLNVPDWETGVQSHPSICNAETLTTYVPAVESGMRVVDEEGKKKKGRKINRMVFPSGLKLMIHSRIQTRAVIRVFDSLFFRFDFCVLFLVSAKQE